MRLLVQRSLNSNVSVNNKIVGKIEKGLVVLVGFTNDDKEKDVILEVYQKGYMLKDKLLRPAMVKVNK